MKMSSSLNTGWHNVIHAVFWAERVTTSRSTGRSPYYMAHGVEPLMPFDLTEATYMIEPFDAPLSHEDLIAARARQLLKREDDLLQVHKQIMKSRFKSVEEFEK